MSISLNLSTTKLSVNLHDELWKVALSALLTELRLDLGIGTAPEDAPSSTGDGYWELDYELDPARVGRLSMTVFDNGGCLFLATQKAPGGFDFEPSFQSVSKMLCEVYGVSYITSVEPDASLSQVKMR
ncbi:hypothetical protein [Rhodococcoides fascians]|uniref:hypothetical protein n=1 Tax=Rhodococcoides fascians TaxID=1828 RepID=UPI001E0DD8FB|nr:hypothetical protein [Rhodococcus fascians]CAH0190223.1 hypothetical protein SRABI91_01654 [Rhodococcus fascians]